jgi:hypothetical protein
VPPAASIRNFGEAELGQPDLAVAAIDGTAGLDVVGRHRMSFVRSAFAILQGASNTAPVVRTRSVSKPAVGTTSEAQERPKGLRRKTAGVLFQT